MTKDVLIEWKAWLDEFARSHGHDFKAMAAVLRDLNKLAGVQVVHGEPRRPETALPAVGGVREVDSVPLT